MDEIAVGVVVEGGGIAVAVGGAGPAVFDPSALEYAVRVGGGQAIDAFARQVTAYVVVIGGGDAAGIGAAGRQARGIVPRGEGLVAERIGHRNNCAIRPHVVHRGVMAAVGHLGAVFGEVVGEGGGATIREVNTGDGGVGK